MKLKEICDFIHNYFVADIYEGDFLIKNNKVISPILDIAENQHYMIEGSKFNDGIIFKYNDLDSEKELINEEFHGVVYALNIPRDVLDLKDEIEEWQEKNKDALGSIYQSESFGGYSYNKGNASGKYGSQISWKDVFGKKLNCYRKIS